MTVTKAVVRGILIAGLAATSARGGSMLHLGVTSSDGPPPLASMTVAASSVPTATAPSLRLGVYSASSPDAFNPVAPSPVASNSANPPTMAVPVAAASLIPALPASPAPSAQPAGPYDAYLNVGAGPYPNAASLTTGGAKPWYLGTSVGLLFGGVPNSQQIAAFDATVLARVQQTFALSGVPVSLTEDPNARAAHTISVISQASNPTLPSALGMTYIGGNGFQYIDTAANAAKSVDQLEWIVAHNLSHELMLAFNVPEVHDQTGQFIDARNATWSMITSPTSTFSPGAVADLLSRNFQAGNGTVLYPSAQLLTSSSVPEPSAVLLWLAIGSAGLVAGRARRGLRAPAG